MLRSNVQGSRTARRATGARLPASLGGLTSRGCFLPGHGVPLRAAKTIAPRTFGHFSARLKLHHRLKIILRRPVGEPEFLPSQKTCRSAPAYSGLCLFGDLQPVEKDAIVSG